MVHWPRIQRRLRGVRVLSEIRLDDVVQMMVVVVVLVAGHILVHVLGRIALRLRLARLTRLTRLLGRVVAFVAAARVVGPVTTHAHIVTGRRVGGHGSVDVPGGGERLIAGLLSVVELVAGEAARVVGGAVLDPRRLLEERAVVRRRRRRGWRRLEARVGRERLEVPGALGERVHAGDGRGVGVVAHVVVVDARWRGGGQLSEVGGGGRGDGGGGGRRRGRGRRGLAGEGAVGADHLGFDARLGARRALRSAPAGAVAVAPACDWLRLERAQLVALPGAGGLLRLEDLGRLHLGFRGRAREVGGGHVLEAPGAELVLAVAGHRVAAEFRVGR